MIAKILKSPLIFSVGFLYFGRVTESRNSNFKVKSYSAGVPFNQNMKSLPLLVVGLLLSKLNVDAQSVLFADRLLEKAVQSNEYGLFMQLRKSQVENILLLDALNLFSPSTITEYQKQKISIIGRHPGNRENFIAVYNVWTEDSTIVMAFMQPYSGHATRYYFSIYGRSIKLKKAKNGYF